MGRKGSWFSSVKKVFGSDSKKDQVSIICLSCYISTLLLLKNQRRFSFKPFIFVHEKKKTQKHHSHSHSHRSKLACFGYHDHHELGNEGSAIAVVPSLPSRKEAKPISEAENEQNKQAFSLVLATAVAAGAAAAAAEVARLKTVPRYPEKMNQDVAAIKIQTQFRGYLVWTCYPMCLHQCCTNN